MPELPDITIYIEALKARIKGRQLRRVEILNPFLLRTASPPISAAEARSIVSVKRLGKRIALQTDNDLWLVIHLMIAGRLTWQASVPPKAKTRGAGKGSRQRLARFEFEHGVLILTEAGAKRRASLHVVAGDDGLAALDPGGLEILDSSLEAFAETLTRRNHTLKRALTDPGLFSGVGNAYSDEILHAARLSPIQHTQKLDSQQIEALYRASCGILDHWTRSLREAADGEFPTKVTAFREGMAVHGRYQQPCPVCDTAIQRIRYASNELNYCPRCQTGGKVLADRSLSRLLRDDWPRTIEQLESGGAA